MPKMESGDNVSYDFVYNIGIVTTFAVVVGCLIRTGLFFAGAFVVVGRFIVVMNT